MKASFGLTAVLFTLAGCASAPPAAAPSDYRITGHINGVQNQLTIFIDGERVIRGPLRLPECSTGRVGGLGGCTPTFPLEGEYRGKPVMVECGRVSPAAIPYCEVSVDGRLAKRLVFSETAKEGGWKAE